ncbi:MAG: FAD-dependent oxidoreductase [Clostridia bacterium]|nr:FAD-dependent oxidoreductase [Clostridia bacterium]
MNDNLMKKILNCDLCVIGGGLSGSFAALSAARHGAKVVLMQDRPMLGGNASSEIRMWVRGAKGTFNRETGLISELEERNIHGNPNLVHSLFDATLYDMLRENRNITLLLNTSCLDAEVEDGRILSVTGWQTTTYTFYTVKASLFMDCSGDSILAPLTGAEYRHGREGRGEYGETLAPETADRHTMGMSIILAARETDAPVPFTPPGFANVYPDDSCFAGDVGASVHAQLRNHKIATSGANLWWVELGGEGDSIHDADRLRDELLAAIYGVWDHIKNRGDHGMENWELEWVGFLPGKRESRRYVGDYVMTEADVISGGHFEDEIAYGGWPMDDHNPYGMRKNERMNIPSVMIPVKEPYGIPLRCLYSKNVENLMFAGRNISVTHAALSSTRVMATCALLGQAAGTAAAVAIGYGIGPRETAREHFREVQELLMDDGVFLPHLKREPSDLTKSAALNLSAQERAVLLNGCERPRTAPGENGICQKIGDRLCFSFDTPQQIDALRLQLDPDFERMSISDNKKMRVFAMKLHTGKDFKPVRVASTIVKSFAVFADGREVARVQDNFRSLVTVPLSVRAKEICVEWIATNGAREVRLFSADLLKG